MSRADAAACDRAFEKMYDDRRAAGLPLHDAPVSNAPPARVVRNRMVEAVITTYSRQQSVAIGDLAAHGFTDREIAEHFRPAIREAGLDRHAL